MKYLVFRFDVDTHKCVKQGMPALLKLAKKHRIKFTFYVNFGRSVDKRSFFKAKLVNEKDVIRHRNLSALTKLGIKDYLVAAILNPEIGKVGKDVINQSIKEGHEIGLHGGSNHERWNQYACTWSKSKISKEIDYGLQKINKINGKYKILGFASPHWQSNKKIAEVLKEKGFKYLSDLHTDKPLQKISHKYPIPNLPVTIGGEPGGVGYIEWCRANGYSDSQILTDFEGKLKKRSKFAIIYDHPYYSGVKEINLLNNMIKIGKQLGFTITTADKVYKLR